MSKYHNVEHVSDYVLLSTWHRDLMCGYAFSPQSAFPYRYIYLPNKYSPEFALHLCWISMRIQLYPIGICHTVHERHDLSFATVYVYTGAKSCFWSRQTNQPTVLRLGYNMIPHVFTLVRYTNSINIPSITIHTRIVSLYVPIINRKEI